MPKAAVSEGLSQEIILAEIDRVKGEIKEAVDRWRTAKAYLKDLNRLSALRDKLDGEEVVSYACKRKSCGRTFTTQGRLTRHLNTVHAA